MKPRIARRSAKVSAPVHRAGRKVIVELPAALYARTEKATSQLSVNRSALIRSALQEYLDKWQRQQLESDLAEGYIANAAQAREVAEDFSYVDSELL
jgi:metal-responsive CopG/Arc/MetJ family transcriptional regulator